MLKVTENQKKYGKQYYIVVTPFFPTATSFRGGYIYDQVNAIAKNSDMEIIVFKATNKYRNSNKSYEYQGIRVNLFFMLDSPSYLFNGIFNKINSWLFYKSFCKHNIPLDRIKFVHCHTSTFGALGIELKRHARHVKVLLQHHCRDPYCVLYGKLSSWYPNLIYRARTNLSLFKKIDLHISISKIVDDNLKLFPSASPKENYQPYLNKINKIKIRNNKLALKSYILYNGVDTNKFYPRISPISPTFTIGCIGNFTEIKDQITLIKACEIIIRKNLIKKLKLIFIGSGPELNKCRNYVETNGLSNYIYFEKELDHSLLRNFYVNLDLFILPSIFEGFGCVYTEAYACGVPFFVCESQGATEYIPETDYDKWVFKQHDYYQLSNKILNYYTNRYKQVLLEPYDINILVNKFIKFIDEIYE